VSRARSRLLEQQILDQLGISECTSGLRIWRATAARAPIE
jgi:hypothetical protein